MTIAQAAAKLPLTVGHGFAGSWIGYYLRGLLTPFVGYEEARGIVALALGPGHDYLAVNHHHAPKTARRKGVRRCR